MMPAELKKLLSRFRPGRLKQFVLQYALKGNTVECVCCGSAFITFLPAGLNLRANAKCIRCGSLERHRVVWKFLREETKLFKQQTVLLHVAPETQFYKEFSVAANISYHPIDLQPDKYVYGSKTKGMDVTDLKYPDAYFDVVICNHVLEHIPDDKKAMQEIFRVLKKGGWAILNVPADLSRKETYEDFSITEPEQRKLVFGQQDHVRIYGSDYINRLQHAGFEVQVIDYVSGFTHNEQFRFGFKANELIYMCNR